MAHLRAGWSMLAVALLSACGDGGGGSGGTGSPNTSGVTCGEGEFALAGTADGQSVSYRGALQGHAWIQSSPKSTLDTPFQGGGSFHAEWTRAIADGESTSITGTVTFPPSGALSGQTFSASAGSLVKEKENVDFSLETLSRSVECVTTPCNPVAVQGSLDGCVHWKPIP